MKLSKLSRASPYMPPLELCLRLSAEGEFATPPDPGHPHAHRFWPLVKLLVVTLRMSDALVIVISTTEIFSLSTNFALDLQTEFLWKFSKTLPLLVFLVLLWL